MLAGSLLIGSLPGVTIASAAVRAPREPDLATPGHAGEDLLGEIALVSLQIARGRLADGAVEGAAPAPPVRCPPIVPARREHPGEGPAAGAGRPRGSDG